jgi:hypothetical protein
MRQFLTERYQQLLARQFRVRFPEQLPGLTLSAEPGVKARRIVHWYDERARSQDKKPITCCFGHPHGRGFVVELEDGRLVLVGRDCAKKDFGFEFDEIVKGFEAERDLQFQVRRLLAVKAALPAAVAELRTLAADARFDAFWQDLMRRYGKASLKLAAGVRTSQGTLMGVRQERNKEAEAREAKKSNPGLFDDYEAADTPEERRVAAARIDKFIQSRPPIFKDVEFPMGPCEGWRLLDGSKRPVLTNLLAQAIAAAGRASIGKPIEQWTKADFAQMRRDLDEVFTTLDTAKEAVEDLLRFTSPANRERIADWAMQCKLNIEIIVPDGFGWPVTPALDALRVASGNVDDEMQKAA